ncbi:MAG: NAD(P)/FAD-dependent oxidoreductase [candidate division KSB1 bacterium]|nr:NAD(P)/FAD-dependent oxidoreductase [candidate division KSB1 bacterium]MDZ7305015.1 NAD(P)/FAD-dependent oxidoreductase [candidate division KSB1 bacterium]MDZ7314140.1 NAD(P)/FAD-dependent oxidoreductase [candidate division KSB1 bacterium]
MPKVYDVLVAGAGPAGLSAAGTAARAGLRVALFERSKEIGYPVHTSGGSWIAELRRLGVPDRFMHPIRTGKFLAPAATATFSYPEPVNCVLEVRGLYQYLAAQAAEAGAEVFPACLVERAILKNDHPIGLIVRPRGEFFAPVIIDATGIAGVLAQQMNLRGPISRYGLGAEQDFYLPDWPADTVALLFGSLAGPAGYGWIFPHGGGRVRIGIGVLRPDTAFDPRALLEHLLARGEIAGCQIKRHAALEFHLGTIPAVPPLVKTSTTGLLVVGDAGGLISTLLGEGIRFALDIGRMAGEVAVEAHRAGRFDSEFLGRFDDRWRRRYGRLFAWVWVINQHLAQYDDSAWNEKIALLSQFPAEAVAALLKGDWSAPPLLAQFWHHRHQFSRTMWRYFQKNIWKKA